MKTTGRFLALLLAFTLAFGTLGTAALAAEASEQAFTITDGAVGEDAASVRAVHMGSIPKGAVLVERQCCALHFVLMFAALVVAVYYTYDRKWRQAREFELRAEL